MNLHVQHYLPKSIANSLFFFIGIYLLYNIILVSAVQQSESAICIHICPPSWISLPTPIPSHPSRSSQSTMLSFLCLISASYCLLLVFSQNGTKLHVEPGRIEMVWSTSCTGSPPDLIYFATMLTPYLHS